MVRVLNQTVPKKDPKTFTLRNINTAVINTPRLLKCEIWKQFKEDIVGADFEVGYVHSSTLVTFRKPTDLVEIWNDIRGGQKHVLWCDGLKVRRKKSNAQLCDDSEDDSESHKGVKKRKVVDDKEERVGRAFEQLKEKHGENYTQFQLRIWSEMYVSGIYSSLEDPHNTSMFIRAGGGDKTKKRSSLSVAITEISAAISSLTNNKISMIKSRR